MPVKAEPLPLAHQEQFGHNSTIPKDKLMLWAGIGFSVLFTGLIWLLGARLATIPHMPDRGASWYYWQLPEQTLWGQVTAWAFYLGHQFAIWGLIYQAQRQKLRYQHGLHGLNIAALGVNALFIFLHLLQTCLLYTSDAADE